MWILNEKTKLFDDDLRKLILASKTNHKIFFLDGPSGCGKTRFVNSLPKERTSITGFNLLYECLTDSMQHSVAAFTECQKQLIQTYCSKGDILCFEDVDVVLLGRPSTQELFARIIREISQTKILILTGISIDERCRTLNELLRPFFYCKWKDEEQKGWLLN